MTEAEYVTATNLARVGVALETIRDVLPDADVPEAEHQEVRRLLRAWQERLFARLDPPPEQTP